MDRDLTFPTESERAFRPEVFVPFAVEVAEPEPQPGAVADFTFPPTGTHVRVVNGGADDDGPWFVATDLAKALGYRDATNLVRGLDSDEKGTHIVSTPGGDQRIRVISVAGLYSAILASRVPEAKAFKRWVTHDVLPAVLHTGSYDINAPEARTAELAQLRRAFTIVQSESVEWEAEAYRLEERCDQLGPRAVGAISDEDRYGGQPLWNVRASLSTSLEVGLREVMGRLVDLGVLVRERPNAFSVQTGWRDLVFCVKTSKRKESVTLHSVVEIGTPMIHPGLQDAFLERIAEAQADRRRRHPRRDAA